MKKMKFINAKTTLLLGLSFILMTSCERNISEDAEIANFASTAEIFTDTPIGMGTDFYFPFIGEATNPIGSKLTAWSIDDNVSYMGSSSMRIDVPNANDPLGNYAGAAFLIDGAGRDLTGYDALTFWAKSSQGAIISEIGFGEDINVVLLKNVSMATEWTKYIIPIPDPSKLTNERGMLRYAAAGINGLGYTFWIDELKFEKLGTIGQVRPFMQGGEDQEGVAFVSQKLTISNLGVTSNLANGTNVTVTAAPNYFNFFSSNPSVASVNLTEVTLDQFGQAVITAEVAGKPANGSLVVNAVALAPTPSLDPANVISIFSDAYTNFPVDYFNGYWAPFQTTQGQDDIDVNGNKIIKYTDLNFVGIEFQGGKSINASSMTHFHMDVFVEDALVPGDFLTIRLLDLGSDNAFGGFDPSGEFRLRSTSSPALVSGSWISVDIPFSRMPSLSSRSNLAQIVFVSDATVKSVFIDNIYFHN
ncbi:MAG: hypothetical protein ACJA1B_000340 [Polaribacter sp.]|jgi:hypothetical protein